MNKKPELSQRLKDRLNELWRMLCERVYTKRELMKHFGTGERQIRDMISLLAKKKPINGTSDKKGYKVATGKEDLDGAIHTRAELISRQKELELRIIPLDRFIDKYTRGDL